MPFQLGGLLSRLKRERIAALDIPDLWSKRMPVWASQVLFAALCASAGVGLRWAIDLFLPAAGPFALMVPTVLVATFFGRLGAGLVCLAITSLYAWYFVLPAYGSFAFEVASDGPRVAVNVLSGAFVVVLADLFRSVMKEALSARETLLLELEHRVKNNFASVAGMLRLQLRATEDEEVRLALGNALGRLESFARANSYLYRDRGYTGSVEMGEYLGELGRSLKASFADRPVRFDVAADRVLMSRDRAILIGLLVNEVATNSVKHAFAGRANGVVRIAFGTREGVCRLEVADDGTGTTAGQPARRGSLGMNLIEALARQAGGRHRVLSDGTGTMHRFEFDA